MQIHQSRDGIMSRTQAIVSPRSLGNPVSALGLLTNQAMMAGGLLKRKGIVVKKSARNNAG